MKRMILIIMAISVLASIGLAQEKQYTLGFDATVLVGKIKYADGGIKSALGLSPLLGIGYKSYFTPLKQDSYSVYWDIGTDLLILPFIGIGADYRFKAGDVPLFAGVNVSSRVATLGIPFPSINIGLYF